MKLKKVFDCLLIESLSDELDNIIFKLENYSKEFRQENHEQYSDELDTIVTNLKDRKFKEALQSIVDSDVRYEIPNTIGMLRKIIDQLNIETNYDKNWGLKPGIYNCFRAGKVENSANGIFFSITLEGAEAYSKSSSREVHQYSVTVQNPIVFKDVIDGLSHFTGKSRSEILELRSRSSNVGDWWITADKKMVRFCMKNHNDSITYTDPAPPAIRELVVFDNKQIKLIQ